MFTVVDHPLIKHKLAILRNKSTEHRTFRELIEEITTLLFFEATRDLKTCKTTVETPLAKAEVEILENDKFVIAPILRAGLSMVEPLLKIAPSAKVAHIGMYRDPSTLKPVSYFFKIPKNPENYMFFIVDPMLATGGSAVEAANTLKKAGGKNIKLLCIIAAPEGVENFTKSHTDIPVFAASLDEKLNSKGYIIPGLGDAGDRIFGTS